MEERLYVHFFDCRQRCQEVEYVAHIFMSLRES